MNAEKVFLPSIGGATEGTVTKWYVKAGQRVKAGQLMAELDMGFATMDFESTSSGYVLYLGVREGESLRQGHLLTVIGDKDTDINQVLREVLEQVAQNGEAGPAMPGQPGEIKMFAGDRIPSNWRICNGQSLLKSEFEKLYFSISDKYGTFGNDTFSLPTIQPLNGVNYIICVQEEWKGIL